MAYAPDTTKYLVHLGLHTEGVVDKPDVIGAIFGQTEGLLGDEMDLRDLQRTGRLGRIDVQIVSSKGETTGEILITSSLDRIETAILAAALETIDRVGPCLAHVNVDTIEDIRVSKRRQIIERAKELLFEKFDETELNSDELMDLVRENVRIEKLTFIGVGDEKSPAGPHVLDSDAIIVVEGRADVINLLRFGIKNAIAVEGTNIPDIVIDLCEKKTTTAFFDGDRGGELILRELMQVADLDYVAICPKEKSVEDLSRKEILRSLRNKVPIEFIRSQSQDKSGLSDFIDEIRNTFENEIQEMNPQDENNSSTLTPAPETGNIRLPKALEVHVSEIIGKNRCRFLSLEYEKIEEFSLEDLDNSWNIIDERAKGFLIDGKVNQQVLDRAAQKGFSFIVANDFTGIIKRPVTIKLIRAG